MFSDAEYQRVLGPIINAEIALRINVREFVIKEVNVIEG